MKISDQTHPSRKIQKEISCIVVLLHLLHLLLVPPELLATGTPILTETGTPVVCVGTHSPHQGLLLESWETET